MAHQLSRKGFLQLAMGVVAAGAVLEACGSDAADSAAVADSTAAAPTTSAAASTSATPSTLATGSCKSNGAKDGGIDDPKHHLVVPAADIVAGVLKTYSIQGTENHDHKVSLEAADFAKLATDAEVLVTSTTDSGHSHTFLVVCA
jgi:hypothetical protein